MTKAEIVATRKKMVEAAREVHLSKYRPEFHAQRKHDFRGYRLAIVNRRVTTKMGLAATKNQIVIAKVHDY